jgi:hypothetical protein
MGEFDHAAFSVPRAGARSRAYNEDAFRYFLELEWKRAARTERPFLLLLVGLMDDGRRNARIAPLLAAKLFSSLWLSVRETDVIGWYRQDRVIGAVLTQLEDQPASDVLPLIRQRVRKILRDALHGGAADRLRMHVYQLRPRTTNSSRPHEHTPS